MYSRQHIVNFVLRYSGVIHPDDLQHPNVLYILEDIQNQLLDPNPSGNFVKQCVNENWDYAKCVADVMNKEILTKTTLFQDFVKLVKTSPEYISNKRENKLNTIFEK